LCTMSNHMQPGVPVRVFEAATADDLGIAHVPSPVELGDELALADHPWPFEVIDAVRTPVGASVAALVKVRPVRVQTG
jgi:hypothetical protein